LNRGVDIPATKATSPTFVKNVSLVRIFTDAALTSRSTARADDPT
jgi:hypothetical protein